MLKELKKNLSYLKKDKNIFDIVVYGSSVKGKNHPNDIDIAVIFIEGSLSQRLEKLQEIKKNIKLDKIIDIKSILLEELCKPEFFGRYGIFLEGISIFDEKPFSFRIGFEGFSIFLYNFKNKSHNEKVKFNYVLSGRNNIGIIKLLNGEHLAPGVIKIPIRNS